MLFQETQRPKGFSQVHTTPVSAHPTGTHIYMHAGRQNIPTHKTKEINLKKEKKIYSMVIERFEGIIRGLKQ